MRIAHCSDLHLLSLDEARFRDFLSKRWIGGLNLLANRGRHHKAPIFAAMVEDMNQANLDHLVVTGDITNLALGEEFHFARTFFDSLNLPPEEVTILPGNHDTYVQEGAEHFAEHFAPFYTSDSEFNSEAQGPWPAVRTRGSITIVSVNTSLTTPWFTAYGVVGEKQLARLGDILTDPKVKQTFRIVALHHCPTAPKATSRVRGLRDHQALQELLSQVGAELVLHGHEHMDLKTQIPGPTSPIPVRGIPSATYDAGDHKEAIRARYRIYEFDDRQRSGESQTWTETLRLWLPKDNRFADSQEVNHAR